MTRNGSCICGAVRFTVTGPLRPVVACHCGQCRKTSGHHVAATSAPRAAITITGTPEWYQSSPTARRGFCGTCGAQMFWETPASPNLSIFAGAFDGPTGLSVAGHIFTAFKGDYYDIPKAAVQAPGADERLTTQ